MSLIFINSVSHHQDNSNIQGKIVETLSLVFRLLPCFKILRLENTQFIMSSTRYSTSKIKQRYYAEILSSNKCCPMQYCIHNSVVQICGVRGSFEMRLCSLSDLQRACVIVKSLHGCSLGPLAEFL